MADAKQPLSPAMQALAEAIRQQGPNVRAALCGFDLWIEVMGSGHTSMVNFKPGGMVADGSEPENTLLVPITVIGGKIVVSFDPTLPPDHFQLKGVAA